MEPQLLRALNAKAGRDADKEDPAAVDALKPPSATGCPQRGCSPKAPRVNSMPTPIQTRVRAEVHAITSMADPTDSRACLCRKRFKHGRTGRRRVAPCSRAPPQAARHDSIRNRILAFAFVATLVPSGVTIWFAYGQAQHWVEQKIKQDLVSESFQTARATGVWLREQLFDLRVFAGSEAVANSLELARGANNRAQ